MLKTDRQVLTENRADSVHGLYNRYAAMLLGYISEIVKDSKLAEETLVRIFSDLAGQHKATEYQGPASWMELRHFAKNYLDGDVAVVNPENLKLTGASVRLSSNIPAGLLSGEQVIIFTAIYYHGKSVKSLAAELDRTEEFIRKTLKEAFARLRDSGEN